jgi:hypothetical protein
MASWLKRYKIDKDKLWKDLIDYKYNTTNPNIFVTNTVGASSFFKGFIWAAQAAKMGYRWKIGNGQKARLWEDNWLGSSSLAIQFWPIYRILNEKGKSVADLWDGVKLKCTFRRNFSSEMYQNWLDIVELVSTIRFTDEEDDMIWHFSSNGVYSSQSLYKVINFRGIKNVHVSAVLGAEDPAPCAFLSLVSD